MVDYLSKDLDFNNFSAGLTIKVILRKPTTKFKKLTTKE